MPFSEIEVMPSEDSFAIPIENATLFKILSMLSYLILLIFSINNGKSQQYSLNDKTRNLSN